MGSQELIVSHSLGTFKWTEQRSTAAVALASGKTKIAAATEANVAEKTIYEWLKEPEFLAEVDRLSLMVDVASRAERLRLAMRVVRQKILEDGTLSTRADLLDWLKFAQSETDGVKLDLSKLATIGETPTPVADS